MLRTDWHGSWISWDGCGFAANFDWAGHATQKFVVVSITIVETIIAVARSALVSQADGRLTTLWLITYAISNHVVSELFPFASEGKPK